MVKIGYFLYLGYIINATTSENVIALHMYLFLKEPIYVILSPYL